MNCVGFVRFMVPSPVCTYVYGDGLSQAIAVLFTWRLNIAPILMYKVFADTILCSYFQQLL